MKQTAKAKIEKRHTIDAAIRKGLTEAKRKCTCINEGIGFQIRHALKEAGFTIIRKHS